ncbi:N-acetyltransferase [Parashewanella curva]|uniref:N-acetyltransferase n=1 Tax=Parashewanella curva TaxID=2338552 RepID=A0A3L8PR53_9GAMM|nr:N-acetyltransferase [Parashewanella curva]RLV57684.1 N-acetyltransferase [Parashewanella curva]
MILAKNELRNLSINKVISAAFENHPYSNQKEHYIVSQLRDDSALDVSLVAIYQGEVIGHIAFSTVKINGNEYSWYGLAPVAVSPLYQKSGVGSKLIKKGTDVIKQKGAEGCFLLGEPNYYERFGFKAMSALVLEGVPPEYFLALSFEGLMRPRNSGHQIK